MRHLTLIFRIVTCELNSDKYYLKVGSGSHVRFWLDKWMGEYTIKSVYSLIANFALNVNSLINEQGILGLGSDFGIC